MFLQGPHDAKITLIFNNIKALTSNSRKFVGTHSENFQFLSGTLFTLLSEVFLDFDNTSVWF